ncbi:MAG: hypothetical protein ABSE40_21605 [Candidatus Sulfotelmatobacter sp.]|jgi:hypothetical protein
MPERNTGKVGALKCDSDSALRLKSFSEVAPSDVEYDAIVPNPEVHRTSAMY